MMRTCVREGSPARVSKRLVSPFSRESRELQRLRSDAARRQMDLRAMRCPGQWILGEAEGSAKMEPMGDNPRAGNGVASIQVCHHPPREYTLPVGGCRGLTRHVWIQTLSTGGWITILRF